MISLRCFAVARFVFMLRSCFPRYLWVQGRDVAVFEGFLEVVFRGVKIANLRRLELVPTSKKILGKSMIS